MKKAILAVLLSGIVSGLLAGCAEKSYICDMCSQQKTGESTKVCVDEDDCITICDHCYNTYVNVVY